MKKLFLLFVVSLVNLICHAQWSSTAPTVVCNASGTQNDATMIFDGVGGYIMAWVDYESSRLDIYIQRLNSDGVPQWTANGLLVCDAANSQYSPLLALCKTSGNQTRVMIVWRDARTSPAKMFAQAYDLNGNAQWATNGVQVADNVSPLVHNVIPSSDGQRVLFTWGKNSFSIYASLYLQAINPDNGSTLYGGDGTLIDADIIQGEAKLSQAEGSTDINIAWSKANDYNIYAQRINPVTGGKQWINSLPVCTAAEVQSELQIQGDIVVWTDDRFSSANREIFAQRLNSNGTVAWTANGINVSNDLAIQRRPSIASAGINSVWVTWRDDVLNNKDTAFVFLQKINSDGTLAFGNQGLRLVSGFEGY